MPHPMNWIACRETNRWQVHIFIHLFQTHRNATKSELLISPQLNWDTADSSITTQITINNDHNKCGVAATVDIPGFPQHFRNA